MRLPSARQHHFSAQPAVHMQRSAFDRRHSNSFTFNSGYLVPFFHEQNVLPGDTINMSAKIFARLNTPYFPIMTNVYLMVHWWYVPNRLVWEHWVNFMGETEEPWSTDPTPPTYLAPISTIPSGGYAVHSLQDYFGLPVVEGTLTREGLPHNVFLLRAYNLTWNKGYRDQNLQDPVVVDIDDGPDSPSDYVLLKRGKRHDYFTSCLPFAQKGDPIGISLTGNAPVKGIGFTDSFGGGIAAADVTETGSGIGAVHYSYSVSPSAIGAGMKIRLTSNPSNYVPDIYADMSSLSALTINEFRQAFLIQELLELDARSGTRYPEMIYAHFGVENPDSRMQYPEYLGGNITQLDITSVPQTSVTAEDPDSNLSPQGNLAAFGTFNSHPSGFVRSFTEHGVLFGLLCVYADLTYSQGLHRHWSRRTRYDWYDPIFANLGEQAVLNKEIYAQGTAGGTDDAGTFGFQERWAEDRYIPNRVGGLFRPGVANTLAAWNLSIEFDDLPVLNDEFIVENPPFSRVVAVPSEPDFKADCYIQMTHVRCMPVMSVPVKLGGGGRRSY